MYRYYQSKTEGRISCDKCVIGMFGSITGGQTESSSCTNCPTGYYGSSVSYDTANICSQCEPGTYTSKIGQHSCETVSFPCLSGKFSPIRGNTMNDPKCKNCPNGKYQNEINSGECKNCVPCVKGTFRPNTGDRSSCLECTTCSSGRYMDDPTKLECETCPFGQASFEGKR